MTIAERADDVAAGEWAKASEELSQVACVAALGLAGEAWRLNRMPREEAPHE